MLKEYNTYTGNVNYYILLRITICCAISDGFLWLVMYKRYHGTTFQHVVISNENMVFGLNTVDILTIHFIAVVQWL